MLNDYYQVACKFTAPNANQNGMFFVLAYQTVSIGTPITNQGEVEEIADEVSETIDSLYVPFIPDSITFDNARAIGLTDSTVEHTNISLTPGSDTDKSLPYRNAVHCKNATGKRGRSFNGRTNLMPCSESQTEEGVIVSSYLASIGIFLAAVRRLSLGTSGNVYDQVVWSPTLNLGTIVTSNILSDSFSTIKNRQAA